MGATIRGRLAIANDSACWALRPSASVTVNVNRAAVAAVGVPVTVPLAESMLSPSGSGPPVTDQVYGPVPPATTGEAS